MNSNNIIKCHNLVANISHSKNVGEALNLDIKKGSITVLTGPDNNSQNDWLKTLGGFYYPATGMINYFGKEATNYNKNDWSRLRRKLAYVTEELNLLSVLSGFANVMLPANYHKLDDPEQYIIKADRLMSELGVSHVSEQLPADMQKEQRFLISIARALMIEPDALFIENPFFLLDTVSAERFKQFLLRKVKEKNMTLIISTQDFHFIKKYADKVVFIAPEKLFSFNSADDFLNCNDSMVLNFIGKANIL